MVDDYRYLWDGSQPGWVLLAAGDDYLPYNQETRRALIIEDDDEFEQVVEKMLELGVPVVQPESLS